MEPKATAMRYIIFLKGEVFCTKWFDPENHHVEGMIVVDLIEALQYRSEAEGWIEVPIDHL